MKQNLSDKLATKKDITGLQTQIDKKLDTEVFLKYKDEMLTKLDKLLGLFHKLNEEKTIGAYRQKEHTDQLENHENRIKSLETATTS